MYHIWEHTTWYQLRPLDVPLCSVVAYGILSLPLVTIPTLFWSMWF